MVDTRIGESVQQVSARARTPVTSRHTFSSRHRIAFHRAPGHTLRAVLSASPKRETRSASLSVHPASRRPSSHHDYLDRVAATREQFEAALEHAARSSAWASAPFAVILVSVAAESDPSEPPSEPQENHLASLRAVAQALITVLPDPAYMLARSDHHTIALLLPDVTAHGSADLVTWLRRAASLRGWTTNGCAVAVSATQWRTGMLPTTFLTAAKAALSQNLGLSPSIETPPRIQRAPTDTLPTTPRPRRRRTGSLPMGTMSLQQ